MQPSGQGPVLTKSDREIKYLLHHILKRKWGYLAIIILSGAFSFYMFKFRYLTYTSTASFFVNNVDIITSATLDMKSIESTSSIDKFNRIYELVNSAPVREHLIKKFDLLKHYGIDSTNEFSYQKASAFLRANISVKKNPFNTIIVSVSDKHRYLAADMANEVVTQVEKLNQDFYINNIQKKVQITEAFVAELKTDNARKSAGIDSLINEINKLVASARTNDKNVLMLLIQNQQLSSIIAEFQKSASDLTNSQKLHFLSLQALNFKNIPTITVISSAMPAFRSIVTQAMTYSILIMFFVTMFLILQAYVYLHYKEYFKYLMKENNHIG